MNESIQAFWFSLVFLPKHVLGSNDQDYSSSKQTPRILSSPIAISNNHLSAQISSTPSILKHYQSFLVERNIFSGKSLDMISSTGVVSIPSPVSSLRPTIIPMKIETSPAPKKLSGGLFASIFGGIFLLLLFGSSILYYQSRRRKLPTQKGNENVKGTECGTYTGERKAYTPSTSPQVFDFSPPSPTWKPSLPSIALMAEKGSPFSTAESALRMNYHQRWNLSNDRVRSMHHPHGSSPLRNEEITIRTNLGPLNRSESQNQSNGNNSLKYKKEMHSTTKSRKISSPGRVMVVKKKPVVSYLESDNGRTGLGISTVDLMARESFAAIQ